MQCNHMEGAWGPCTTQHTIGVPTRQPTSAAPLPRAARGGAQPGAGLVGRVQEPQVHAGQLDAQGCEPGRGHGRRPVPGPHGDLAGGLPGARATHGTTSVALTPTSHHLQPPSTDRRGAALHQQGRPQELDLVHNAMAT